MTAQCGVGPQAGLVVVTGTGFSPGRVDLTVDGRRGELGPHAVPAGAINGSVPAALKDGSHVVEASAGSVHAAAQFTTPCGGTSPQPGPAPPLNPELEDVLDILQLQFSFLFERQHDAVNAVERDLHAPTEESFGRKAVKAIETLALTALYGAGARRPDPTTHRQRGAEELVGRRARAPEDPGD